MPIATEFAPARAAPRTSGRVRKHRRAMTDSGPHPADIHVGRRLRMRRMTLGMSQTALGQHVGLTFQQIQKYERGANRIGASRLYELAQILGVSVSYFFEEMPEAATGRTAAAPAREIGKDEMRLLATYMAIGDARIRKSLYNLMRSLGGKAAAER